MSEIGEKARFGPMRHSKTHSEVTPVDVVNRLANNSGRDKEAINMQANSCRDLGRECLSLLTAQ
jgi:hypothetical protein